jgi:hypothetical protein
MPGLALIDDGVNPPIHLRYLHVIFQWLGCIDLARSAACCKTLRLKQSSIHWELESELSIPEEVAKRALQASRPYDYALCRREQWSWSFALYQATRCRSCRFMHPQPTAKCDKCQAPVMTAVETPKPRPPPPAPLPPAPLSPASTSPPPWVQSIVRDMGTFLRSPKEQAKGITHLQRFAQCARKAGLVIESGGAEAIAAGLNACSSGASITSVCGDSHTLCPQPLAPS